MIKERQKNDKKTYIHRISIQSHIAHCKGVAIQTSTSESPSFYSDAGPRSVKFTSISNSSLPNLQHLVSQNAQIPRSQTHSRSRPSSDRRRPSFSPLPHLPPHQPPLPTGKPHPNLNLLPTSHPPNPQFHPLLPHHHQPPTASAHQQTFMAARHERTRQSRTPKASSRDYKRLQRNCRRTRLFLHRRLARDVSRREGPPPPQTSTPSKARQHRPKTRTSQHPN
jgi:hypothetical protein